MCQETRLGPNYTKPTLQIGFFWDETITTEVYHQASFNSHESTSTTLIVTAKLLPSLCNTSGWLLTHWQINTLTPWFLRWEVLKGPIKISEKAQSIFDQITFDPELCALFYAMTPSYRLPTKEQFHQFRLPARYYHYSNHCIIHQLRVFLYLFLYSTNISQC